MMNIPKLPYPNSGDRPNHTDITQLSDAVAALVGQVNFLSPDEGATTPTHLRPTDTFLGRVRASPPSGKPAAPAGTYYVDRLNLPPTQNPAGLIAPVVDQTPGIALTVLATNEAELTSAVPPAHSGSASPVKPGQTVKVTRWVSRTAVSGTPPTFTSTGGHSLFTFYFGGGGNTFFVDLVQNGGDNGVANVSAANLTYDVFDASGQIGTAVEVVAGRARMAATPVIPAGKGMAYYDATGALKIWDCDEKWGTGCLT